MGEEVLDLTIDEDDLEEDVDETEAIGHIGIEPSAIQTTAVGFSTPWSVEVYEEEEY